MPASRRLTLLLALGTSALTWAFFAAPPRGPPGIAHSRAPFDVAQTSTRGGGPGRECRAQRKNNAWGSRPGRLWQSAGTEPDVAGEVDVVPAGAGQLGDVPSGNVDRICILGGGFGGLYTALRLDQLPWRGHKPSITLIDKKDKFAFLPLLYEYAVGEAELDEVAPTFNELLAGTSISFVQASVLGVDLKEKEVRVAGMVADDLDGCLISDNKDQERRLKFEELVLALGAEAAAPSVPGAMENAIPFYTVEDSFRVKKAVRELQASRKPFASVTVVGGSYSGVELACNLVARLGKEKARVTLVTSADVLPWATEQNRGVGTERLRDLGVELIADVAVIHVRPGGDVVVAPAEEVRRRQREGGERGGGEEATGVVGEEGDTPPATSPTTRTIPSDLVIWTAGSRPVSMLSSLDLPQDGRGRVVVDGLLRVGEVEGVGGASAGTKGGGVYCLGDAACVEGRDLPANAQVALQQSDYVAWNIWAGRSGRRPLEFRYTNLGELITLGPFDASMTTLGGRVNLSGPAAALIRRALYAVRMPTAGQRVRAATSAAAATAFQLTGKLFQRGLGVLDGKGWGSSSDGDHDGQ